ncbi:MAG: hypothetical protein ACI8P0_001025 [Planctomycetaceae bacterium]|jgi:hypothetical protein
MTRHQTGNSLIRALNVINTALIENHEYWPWSQVIETAGSRLAGGNLIVSIEDDRSESDHEEQFLIQVRNDRFCLVSDPSANADDEFGNDKEAAASVNADWKVTTRYLDDLACRARYYVEHPGRIGLGWLTDRLGLASPG